MVPATSDRNFTPSSTALSAPPSTSAGAALLGQMVTTVDGADVMVMLSDLVAVWMGLPASLTWAVKLTVPVAVGVPVMAPLVELSVRPAGRDPLVIDQVYGVVPPLAVKRRRIGHVHDSVGQRRSS